MFPIFLAILKFCTIQRLFYHSITLTSSLIRNYVSEENGFKPKEKFWENGRGELVVKILGKYFQISEDIPSA